jgi:hypothetical protein
MGPGYTLLPSPQCVEGIRSYSILGGPLRTFIDNIAPDHAGACRITWLQRCVTGYPR